MLQDKKHLTALIHIGSGSVSGLLMNIQENKKPEILTHYKSQANLSSSLEPHFLRREMEKSLKNAVAALAKKAGLQGTESAICLFSSPWYTSQTKLVRLDKKEPFEITSSLIDQLKKEEIKDLRRKEIKFVEKEIMKFVLNGYDIKNPFGKKPKNLNLHFYFSFIKKEIAEKTEEIIKHHLKTPSVKFHTFPFVGFNSLRDLFGLKQGFLFVDFGEELTEIVLSPGNHIEETASFALGSGFFIRRIASSFKLDLPETAAFLNQYQSNHLHQEESRKLELVIREAGTKWSGLFIQALKEMESQGLLPMKMFFFGENTPGLLGRLVEMVKDDFRPKIIFPAGLKNRFVFFDQSEKLSNVLMLLLALFVNNQYTLYN